MANIFQRFFREWAIERRRKAERATVDLKGEEIVYTRRRRPQRMAWKDIVRIDAGVVALVSGDLFKVAIVSEKMRWEIDEFVDGFAALEAEIFKRFPSVHDKWLELHRAHAHRDILETLWKRE